MQEAMTKMKEDLTLNKQAVRTEKVERLTQTRNVRKEIGNLLEATEIQTPVDSPLDLATATATTATEIYAPSPLDLATATTDLTIELEDPLNLWDGGVTNWNGHSLGCGHTP